MRLLQGLERARPIEVDRSCGDRGPGTKTGMESSASAARTRNLVKIGSLDVELVSKQFPRQIAAVERAERRERQTVLVEQVPDQRLHFLRASRPRWRRACRPS